MLKKLPRYFRLVTLVKGHVGWLHPEEVLEINIKFNCTVIQVYCVESCRRLVGRKSMEFKVKHFWVPLVNSLHVASERHTLSEPHFQTL